MSNNFELLDLEAEHLRVLGGFDKNVGVFSVMAVNEVIKREEGKPAPEQLYKCFWYEGEISCLFATSGNGKSILAVQIAEDIARRYRSKRVLYFDFELSDYQFAQRCFYDGHRHAFPTNFGRATFNMETYRRQTLEELVCGLENVAKANAANVLIIDNLMSICPDSEKAKDSAEFMSALRKLKIQYGWSVLVINHTPKRNPTNPITGNDMKGSSVLFNFFDSVFAIGISARDDKLRYMKQIKARYGEIEYGSDNVLICNLERAEDGFLHFMECGMDSERNHLQELSDDDAETMKERIMYLKDKGMSVRKIAGEVGISPSKVFRTIKKNE